MNESKVFNCLTSPVYRPALNLKGMAKGKIMDLFPPGNDGSQDGAGRVTDESGKEYVFMTPDDVAQAAVPLGPTTQVSFDINGELATNLQKN